jgi:hypothetical protein
VSEFKKGGGVDMEDNIFDRAKEIQKAEHKQIRNTLLVCAIGAVVLAVILNITGCAPPSHQQQNATKEYVFCLVNQARKIDDGRSDAATIAYAMQNSCLNELANVGAFSANARQQAALNAVLYARNHPN